MKLAFPLLALVLASTLGVREASACSPQNPTPGWKVTDSIASANGLPTDAPIPLGLFFVREYSGGSDEVRGTVRIEVTTVDGAEVAGTFEPNDADQSIFGFDSFFRPSAPLAPGTRYRVKTTIDDGAMLEGPAVRTFELTTTAGPLQLALPTNLVATATTTWRGKGGAYACCDGAKPRDINSCGTTSVGHCFSTAGDPRMEVTLSWSALSAADMPFLAFRLVDPGAPAEGSGLGVGTTSASVSFKEEAARYCVSLEVTNRAIPNGGSVKSTPICAEHGSQPSFEDFVPDFASEASECKGAIIRYDAEGESTGELLVPGKASALDDGGCSTGGHGTGGAGLVAVVGVLLSARGRRTRRSSPCS